MSLKAVFQPAMFIPPRAEDTPLFNGQPLTTSLKDITQKYGVFSDEDLGEKSPRYLSPRLLLTQPASAEEDHCLQGISDLLKRLDIFSCCTTSGFCCQTLPDLYAPHYEIAVDSSPWEVLGEDRTEEIESCI